MQEYGGITLYFLNLEDHVKPVGEKLESNHTWIYEIAWAQVLFGTRQLIYVADKENGYTVLGSPRRGG